MPSTPRLGAFSFVSGKGLSKRTTFIAKGIIIYCHVFNYKLLTFAGRKCRFVNGVYFMKLRFIILFVFCLLLYKGASAQEVSAGYMLPRILFLVDESSSMLQDWANGAPKNKVANDIINRLMDSVSAVNHNVQFSLRVFGNQHTVPEHDCTDTKSEVAFSPDNRTQMSFRLDAMRPLGVTAIAYSLTRAAEEDLVDESHYAYSIILVTDGGESCNGDICGVMQMLLKKKIFFKPYVLSLEDLPELKTEYECMGNYLAVSKPSDINKAVNKIVDAFRPMLNISNEDYKKIQVIASKAPSALKVNMPTTKTAIPVEPEKPKVVEQPRPVLADTVKPKPKQSNIVVGELVKRPAPVTMKKIKAQALKPFFVGVTRPKALPEIPVTPVEIKVSEDEAAPPHSAPVKLTYIKMPGYKLVKVPHVAFGKVPTAEVPQLTIKTDPPVVITQVKMTKVKTIAMHRLPVNGAAPLMLSTRPLPALTIKTEQVEPAPVAVAPVEPPKPKIVRTPLKMPKLKNGKFRMHLLYVNTFLDSDLKPVKLPPLVINTTLPEPPKTPVIAKQPTPNPTKTTPPKPAPIAKTGEYKVEHEDAQETTLEVYLTDGKGRFFYATPRVFILDPVTNKEIKRFFRTVNEAGEPDPVTNLPAGKYDLTIAGRDDLLAHVDMQPNKRNKVYVKVKNFSLYFYYEDAPNRPVKEFVATVIQRNTNNGKVTTQKGTEKLEYEPGNYHIVINTFPEDIRNIDLDAASAGGIAIPQPGFVKFTSEVNTNTVTLSRELGDKYLQFATINLSDPRAQHLQIQPGKYQAHYSNGTSKFSSSDRVIPFQVIGTQETEVILKK